jgi:hypothetical protein
MFFFYFICILIKIIQINSSLASCRQTFGSNKYDLNQLSHLTLLGDRNSYRYALTPCGLISKDKCGKPGTSPFEPGMTACQERIATTTFESSLGFLDGYGKSPDIIFSENPQGPGTGVVMSMSNAICNSHERKVNVTFICDKSVKNPTTMDVIEAPVCTFSITVKAAGACPTTGGGIGGGAIFIIILLVLVVIYVLGGILYNRFKLKHTGVAVLPHPTFWLLVFTSFITGCKMTWVFIRSCGRETPRSSAAYQSV